MWQKYKMDSQNSFNLKYLATFFFQLEKEYDLMDYQVDGINIWQYQRLRLFSLVAQKLNISESAHIKKTGLLDILSASHSLFYHALFSNPLSGKYQKKYLIFSSGRKVKVDERYIDIYTEFLEKDLENGSYDLIDELNLNKHYPANGEKRRCQDYQQITTYLKSQFSRFKFTLNDETFILNLQSKIEQELGAKIELLELLRKGYLTFKFDFQFYSRLLKKRKPEKVFLVCSYGYKMALIAAAKRLDIQTIELQHGVMSKYHLGYSYPDNDAVEYFPDKIYFFGAYWRDCMHFPLPDENKEIYGFPYFRWQKERFNTVHKTHKQILVISQGTIGKKLATFLWECRDILKEYTLTYKLHPGEYGRWKETYPDLVRLSNLENVEIAKKEDLLYSLLAESEFVIGVSSTVVYEALAFNCKVILANLYGVENLEDLVAKGIVKLAKFPSEIGGLLGTSNFKKFESEYFFR